MITVKLQMDYKHTNYLNTSFTEIRDTQCVARYALLCSFLACSLLLFNQLHSASALPRRVSKETQSLSQD